MTSIFPFFQKYLYTFAKAHNFISTRQVNDKHSLADKQSSEEHTWPPGAGPALMQSWEVHHVCELYGTHTSQPLLGIMGPHHLTARTYTPGTHSTLCAPLVAWNPLLLKRRLCLCYSSLPDHRLARYFRAQKGPGRKTLLHPQEFVGLRHRVCWQASRASGQSHGEAPVWGPQPFTVREQQEEKAHLRGPWSQADTGPTRGPQIRGEQGVSVATPTYRGSKEFPMTRFKTYYQCFWNKHFGERIVFT